MFRLVSFVITALLLGTPVYAQDKTSEIDKIFSSATPASFGQKITIRRPGPMIASTPRLRQSRYRAGFSGFRWSGEGDEVGVVLVPEILDAVRQQDQPLR